MLIFFETFFNFVEEEVKYGIFFRDLNLTFKIRKFHAL